MAKTAKPPRKRPPLPPGSIAEHQPIAITTQDDALEIQVPETQLDRIERALADIAERVARIDNRHRHLD